MFFPLPGLLTAVLTATHPETVTHLWLLRAKGPASPKADANFPCSSGIFLLYILLLQRSECELFNSLKTIHSVRIPLWPLLVMPCHFHCQSPQEPMVTVGNVGNPPVSNISHLFPNISRLSSLPPASSWIQSVLPSVTRPQTLFP